ncbi:MAG: hypothetical protein ACLRV8_05620 [Blautia hansenii]
MKIWKFLKTNRQFTLFLTLALGIAAIAVFAPWIAPKDPYEAVMSHSLQARAEENISAVRISWEEMCFPELSTAPVLLWS